MSEGDLTEQLEKIVTDLNRDLARIFTGRANPRALDSVMVHHYGVSTPVSRAASITAPEPRVMAIKPWDSGSQNQIEQVLREADLGMAVRVVDGVVRLEAPALTEQGRADAVEKIRARGAAATEAVDNALQAGEQQGQRAATYHHRIDEEVAAKEREVNTV
ncbi:ribosome-recycling factor [Streptomyces sp. B-S-A8]|uniref:Ribosome-recycling factor n=1 Tax=Streptomyces solicavernae TaxID=3043614 RepID=A0ABT6S000_9ACTN|nr:ribosome-recycling factor [Streptomyces sp. B-S-A8]MDI3390018.1 ribosome-recycling factor [Streptomyces sp. B-S-A8]